MNEITKIHKINLIKKELNHKMIVNTNEIDEQVKQKQKFHPKFILKFLKFEIVVRWILNIWTLTKKKVVTMFSQVTFFVCKQLDSLNEEKHFPLFTMFHAILRFQSWIILGTRFIPCYPSGYKRLKLNKKKRGKMVNFFFQVIKKTFSFSI